MLNLQINGDAGDFVVIQRSMYVFNRRCGHQCVSVHIHVYAYIYLFGCSTYVHMFSCDCARICVLCVCARARVCVFCNRPVPLSVPMTSGGGVIRRLRCRSLCDGR